MLSTQFATIVAGFAAGIAVICFISAWRAVKYARNAENFAQEALDYVQKHNASDLSLAQLAELQAGMTELTDSYHALLDSHKKLRSRIGMRENREKKNGADNTKGADSDDYYRKKQALREEAKQRGYNV